MPRYFRLIGAGYLSLVLVSGCGNPEKPVPPAAPIQEFPPVSLGATHSPAQVAKDAAEPDGGSNRRTSLMQAQASAELDAFLTNYFRTWSEGDMAGYRTHFHSQARVIYVDDGKVDHVLDAEAFFRQQERFIKESNGLVEEHRIDSVVQEGPLGASAVVHWKLSEDGRVTTGIDRFTIIRTDEGAWKIISLTYYETDF